MRKNLSIAATVRAEYPYTLIVSLIYKRQRDDGIPNDHYELSRLDRMEEAIADKFEIEHGAIFGLVCTGDGTRDIFLFLPRAVEDHVIENAIQAINPEADYSFEVRFDPAWRPYHRLMPE